MGTPTTWRDCCLTSPALDRNELMVGKCANRISVVHFQSIRSSGNLRVSPTGRYRERRPGLSQFVPSPTINSVRSIAYELRLPSHRVVGVQLEIRICIPRLPALWPVASREYHIGSVCTLRLNAGVQTPRHASSWEVVSQWKTQLRGVTAV
jgi:hypothetical protein